MIDNVNKKDLGFNPASSFELPFIGRRKEQKILEAKFNWLDSTRSAKMNI